MLKTKCTVILIMILILCFSFCGCTVTFNDDNSDPESEIFETTMNETEMENDDVEPIAEYLANDMVKITIPGQFYGQVKYAIITNDKGETETISIPDSRIVGLTVKLDKIIIQEGSEEYVNFIVTLYNEKDDPIAENISS